MSRRPRELLPFPRSLATAALLVALMGVFAGQMAYVSAQAGPAGSFIVNGNEMTPHSEPYLVWISPPPKYGNGACGGAIIGKSWVLTAAHCILKPFLLKLLPFEVHAGGHNRSDASENRQKTTAKEIFVHPGWKYDSVMDNDIALLYLKEPLDLDQPNVGTIPINTDASCPCDNEKCKVMGWGDDKENGTGTQVAMETMLKGFNYEECKRIYKTEVRQIVRTDIHNDTMFCLGPVGDKLTDTCQGDSGGPVMCTCDGKTKVHTGVVSFGDGCARPGIPGVYARTATYAPWIKKCMETQGKDCPRVIFRYPGGFGIGPGLA